MAASLAALCACTGPLAQASAARANRARGVRAAQGAVAVGVSSTRVGRPLPSGFLGFSFEYPALLAYAGTDPRHLNPVLLSLIRQLNPGQAPLLRIGGNSTDETWWPQPGLLAPEPVSYPLSADWLAVAHALAVRLRARLILGINLEANSTALAADEARALLWGIGRGSIAALEVGNEPDLFGRAVWARNRNGRVIRGRARAWSFADYLRAFARWRAALPPLPLAGPAFATVGWMRDLPALLAAQPLGYVTFHIYPLRACPVPARSPEHPSIANLLSAYATSGIAQTVAPFVLEAHAHGIPFRVDELNSASCEGARGVSNTFASALWVLDTLFNLAAVGVDGINLHTLPGAVYAPFTFTRRRGVWRGTVRPIYYGMLMFARAFPPGAQLLSTSAPRGPLQAWATIDPDGTIHVVLINESLTVSQQVALTLPGGEISNPPAAPTPEPPLTVQSLSAPSASATGDVSIAGQSYPRQTRSGTLAGRLRAPRLDAVGGRYYVSLPPASAMMLTR